MKSVITANKKLIIIFLFIIAAIPALSFLLGTRLSVSSPAGQNFGRNIVAPSGNPQPSSNLSPLDVLRKNLAAALPSPQSSTTPPPSNSPTFGAVLSFKVILEGRPTNDQHTKMFVGIASGDITNNPNYILQVNVDVPPSGVYSGVSLAGLNNGASYTAYLKGLTQLVKGVPFVMNPIGVNLNNGDPIKLTTGDLNQDNAIDQFDLDIAKAALGTTPTSSNWNANADFDLDGVVNNFDLAIILNNMGKIGDSGKWYSSTPNASKSGNFIKPPNIGGSSGGHWLWVPVD